MRYILDVGEVERSRRLEICKTCSNKIIKEIPLTRIPYDCCNQCGCPLATRVYTFCPVKKW